MTTPSTCIDFEPFTKDTWVGLSGARRFPDGAAPLVNASKVTVDDEDAMVVVDGNGVGIFWGDNVISFHGMMALRALAMLRTAMTAAEISALPGAQ
jgi:hypothetical protein